MDLKKLLNPRKEIIMNEVFKLFSLLFARWRYPFSTPEDIASDIGLNITNKLSFEEFIAYVTNPSYLPAKILKFMPRDDAEELFRGALRKEKFRHNSLFSYYFNEGWMEFVLQFDEESRLRRLYIVHKELKQKVEIPILVPPESWKSSASVKAPPIE